MTPLQARRPRIITSVRDALGTTLAICRQDDWYVVGTISSHQHLCPLADARFATYDAAYTRLKHELRLRQAMLATAPRSEEAP